MVEARDTAKHPIMHGTVPITKNYQSPNVNRASVEKLHSKLKQVNLQIQRTPSKKKKKIAKLTNSKFTKFCYWYKDPNIIKVAFHMIKTMTLIINA